MLQGCFLGSTGSFAALVYEVSVGGHGRVYMPKADAKLILYDQNKITGGFSLAYDLSK
jgi:hypothetical protein